MAALAVGALVGLGSGIAAGYSKARESKKAQKKIKARTKEKRDIALADLARQREATLREHKFIREPQLAQSMASRFGSRFKEGTPYQTAEDLRKKALEDTLAGISGRERTIQLNYEIGKIQTKYNRKAAYIDALNNLNQSTSQASSQYGGGAYGAF